MHLYLTYAAFGWLTFTGTMHFIVDVALQYFRGKRIPSDETTLYYGLNSAFSLGQVLFGLICLWLTFQQPNFLSHRSVALLSFAAAVGWMSITVLFMEYWEPKMAVGIFMALLVAAIATAR